MDSKPVSVLVVDDSALMRNLISRIVESAPDLVVCGKAMNGVFALQKLEKLPADVIVLDIEMPEMNGIEFLRERRKRNLQVPVVILSSIAQKGAKVTMEALALGASDFIMKPSGPESDDLHTIGEQLIHMLRSYGGEYKRRVLAEQVSGAGPVTPTVSGSAAAGTSAPKSKSPAVEQPSAAPRSYDAVEFETDLSVAEAGVDEQLDALVEKRRKDPKAAGPIEVIAIGISTGGPNALRQLFAQIDRNLKVPILVVQHMPAGFTEEFARSLDRICPLEVKEAADGDLVKTGRVMIAPGNRHLGLEKKALGTVVRISDTAPVNGHRPSADVLFDQVTDVYGGRAIGVIMTGMGRDGAQSIGKIDRMGGITIAQDAATSIVYGMPKVAVEKGFIQLQVPLQSIAPALNRLAWEFA